MKRLANTSGPPSAPTKLISNDLVITDPKKILVELGSHFFPAPTADDAQHIETIAFVNDSLSTSYEPLSLSAIELDFAVAALRSTTTPGPDGFSAAWLKIAYPLLKDHFLSILRACMKICFFPSSLPCVTL